jgi:hypothetical protein
MANIKPDRDNWRQFCEEPPLTEDEYERWCAMADVVTADDDLLTEMIEAVPADRTPIMFGDDWSDVVERIDARRRTDRAELAWWEKRGSA